MVFSFVCSHPSAHEWHGEVYSSLSDGGDGHVDHCHVRLLRPQLGDHARPPDQVDHEDDDHGYDRVNDIHEHYFNCCEN